jgi:fructose-bisphosphate aldolase, class II
VQGWFGTTSALDPTREPPMPVVRTSEIVGAAAARGSAATAMNVVQLEGVTAIVDGADRAGLPVILAVSENAVRYHGALEPLALSALAAARAASVPVSVHLDHATALDLVREAVGLGLSSVMVDASALPYDANVAATADVAAYCHEHGVWVEAELGEVGGKDGVHAAGARTDPDEATRFVERTGVDALAVAVGSSHKMTERKASLDLDLVRRLADSIPVPLVLHGSSGVPDDGLRAAVAAGMRKINVATQLNKVFTSAVRRSLDAAPQLVDPRVYLGDGRAAMAAEVERLLRVVSG